MVSTQDSAHPLYVAVYMTGGIDGADADGGSLVDGGFVIYPTPGRGDPEFMNVIPTSQYLTHYTFFTDPTYPETNLVVIRKADTQFHDVILDCAGTLMGWQPIGSNYEYTRIDLQTGDFQPVGSCDNGSHEIHSDGAFTVTVWGWGTEATGYGFNNPTFSQWVSYGYPVGAGVLTVNNVVVTPN